MPDLHYAHPRLAEVYDVIEGDRADLDPYVDLVDEFAATSVVDVGCGTGTLACRFADRGLDAIGADPAEASLALARRKHCAVQWLHAGAADLPAVGVDLATMTGNAAQAILDDDWSSALAGVRRALRPGGVFVFETRNPADRAWERWADRAVINIELPDGSDLTYWIEVTDVTLPLVTFDSHYRFDDQTLVSRSVLRFRDLSEVSADLTSAGFTVTDVRDAPDRPGREFVFVAQS